MSERLFPLRLTFESYSPTSFNVLFLWIGGREHSLKGCQRQIITLLPLVSHPYTHRHTTAWANVYFYSMCTCRHTIFRREGGQFQEAWHIQPLLPSPFAFLSTTSFLQLPNLSSHREKFIHTQERNHLQVWREDPILVKSCPCEKFSPDFWGDRSTMIRIWVIKFRRVTNYKQKLLLWEVAWII